jgi:hypothetical protein
MARTAMGRCYRNIRKSLPGEAPSFALRMCKAIQKHCIEAHGRTGYAHAKCVIKKSRKFL